RGVWGSAGAPRGAVRRGAAGGGGGGSAAARLEAKAADGWTTLTELADTLVREDGLPFRTAHAIAQRLIDARQREPQRPLVDLLADATKDLVGTPLKYSDAELARGLSPRHFVEIRKTFGGPAPEETARAATASRQQLETDEAWWSNATDALAKAERLLAERSDAL